MSELSGEVVGRQWRYYAKVTPLPDGKWEVAVWSGDPFWNRTNGVFPRFVAARLSLPLYAVQRVVRTDRQARRVGARMVARCEKRHAAKFEREAFEVPRTLPEQPGGGA